MIILYQFPPYFDLPNMSPFCMKVETYLKLANIPYENKYVANPRKSPKGKFPFIKDGDQIIADSEIIIDYLKERYGDPLDANLTAHQKATALLLERLFGEHLYWCVLYFRWVDDHGWQHIRDVFFAKLPKLLKSFIANKIRKKMELAIYYQGIGRHSPAEILKMATKDLDAIAILLANNTYILGNQPTSIDATAFGFLENLVRNPFEGLLKDLGLKHKNIVDYCERMRKYYEVVQSVCSAREH